ncbi:MAG: hypothetical protein J6A28_03625 [Clostridia bacterium]|nr:hypothetical protein [Clostridia bacterium]
MRRAESHEALDEREKIEQEIEELNKAEEELRALERQKKAEERQKKIQEANENILKAKAKRDEAISVYKLGQGTYITSNFLIPLGILVFIAPLLGGLTGAIGGFLAGAGLFTMTSGALLRDELCTKNKVAALNEKVRQAEQEYQYALEYAASL